MRPTRNVATLLAGALVAIALVLALGPAPHAVGEQLDPLNSVFQLFTYTKQGEDVAMGTAFFIHPMGLALTNSHVVSRAQHDPSHYVLLAIHHTRVYGVEILCASRLRYPAPRAPMERDVALIQLTTPDITFVLSGTRPDGTRVRPQPHVGPLPAFPPLTLGDPPQNGTHVRVIGFWRASQAVEKLVATGTVVKVRVVEDGTPEFEIQPVDRPEQGSSGSPVLDDQNHVVGMLTWGYDHDHPSVGAISSTGLSPACP
jgi:hypothetical protein